MSVSLPRALSSIRARLLLLALLPSLAVFVLAGIMTVEQWDTRSERSTLVGLVQSSSEMSGLAHNLQAERGATNTYVATKGAQLADRIPTLRKATDESLASVEAALADSGLSDEAAAPLQKALAETRGIATIRQMRGSSFQP